MAHLILFPIRCNGVELPNFLPPKGAPGQFEEIDMSSMFTIVKVRDGITSYGDPCWYQNPPGTVAGPWPIPKALQDKAA